MNCVQGLGCAGLLLLTVGMSRGADGQLSTRLGEVSVIAPDETSSSATGRGAELPDAPEVAVFGRAKDRSGVNIQYQAHIRPFSQIAVALKVGAEGIGVDVATPLSNKWNLRGGVSFLAGSYNFSVTNTSGGVANFGTTVQGAAIDVVFKPHFRSVEVSADWFPRYGSFRISPGLTLYNGDRATVLATVLGGQTLGVGNATYTSDPLDPIVATLVTRLGRTVAPRLTVGWGNMIPRAGEHFSFPFEVGVEYVGKPQLTLSLAGSECDPNGGGCSPLTTDPTTQQNIQDEQRDLNSDITFLRFYPILTTGVSYRF